MKKVALAVVLSVAVAGTSQAEGIVPSIGGGIAAGLVTASPFLLGVLIGNDMAKPIPACYSEPVRRVAWANNPNGYTFSVAGCDYQAKKDQLVVK